MNISRARIEQALAEKWHLAVRRNSARGWQHLADTLYAWSTLAAHAGARAEMALLKDAADLAEARWLMVDEEQQRRVAA